MREIKFRAWHIPTQQMLPYAQIGVIRTFTENGSYLSKECIFLQYTGLKDKNGKEIYESDIVNIDWLIIPVIWYAGAWMVEYFTIPTKSYLSHFDELDVEIIGNIYENADLLSTQPSQE